MTSRPATAAIDSAWPTAIGTNAKMPEVCAAMGLTSLESASAFAEANRLNFETYLEHLDGVPGVRMLPAPVEGSWNHQYAVVEIDSGNAALYWRLTRKTSAVASTGVSFKITERSEKCWRRMAARSALRGTSRPSFS